MPPRAQELARLALVELQREHSCDGVVLTWSDDATTIVDLVPDRRGSGLQVGDQIPFRAPLGASVAAWADEGTLARWLEAGHPSDELRRAYIELLAAVRSRGFAVELTGTVGARIYEVLAQIGGAAGRGRPGRRAGAGPARRHRGRGGRARGLPPRAPRPPVPATGWGR